MSHIPDPSDASLFVSLTDLIPSLILEIRYYSSYNFVGERIDGYHAPIALMTREGAEALKGVADRLLDDGLLLRVYDAYRPQAAVDHFVRWAEDTSDLRMKPYFYPEIDKHRLFDLGFIARRSGHTRGSTVDLTLFDMKTGKDLDMGGPFDFFGDVSRSDYTGLSEDQLSNRLRLKNAMVSGGFRPYIGEWWHFTLSGEPYPDTYFTFPVAPPVA